MRKKLILYFKRRNHARKQWVSHPAPPPPGPWAPSRPLWATPTGPPRFCSCPHPECPSCEEKWGPGLGRPGGPGPGLEGILPLPLQPARGERRGWRGRCVPGPRTLGLPGGGATGPRAGGGDAGVSQEPGSPAGGGRVTADGPLWGDTCGRGVAVHVVGGVGLSDGGGSPASAPSVVRVRGAGSQGPT